MSTRPISHQAIAASAGSGKTFQLAHRYIRLLAYGVKPDRIIALTFSRKAAGEIFDSIIKHLREAAGSAEQAQRTSERIERPGFGQNDFLRMLREMLASLHRLHVGTLDSFTVGVIRTFPLELGIPMNFQMLDSDGATAKIARQEAQGKIFDPRYVDRRAQQEFLKAFKQATFGQEEKGLQRSLDAFINDYHNCYQILPSHHAWGQENMIWHEGSPWLMPADDVTTVAEKLWGLLGRGGLSENVLSRWRTFIDAVRNFGIGSPWTRDVEYLFEKLMEDVEGLRHGNATIKIGRTQCALSQEQSQLALDLLAHIMNTELNTALEKTRGIYQILAKYEKFYDETMHHQGKLTFVDAQYLLTEANSHSRGALLSRFPGEEDMRLYIDYRLDCKLDHWLLDEFQDTSDLQWEVLRNLADEILQDASGMRSFFYVGDVKQAIYGWRGGNARLFGKVLEQYRDQIKQTPLNTSFRSCQPVIDAVNHVFGHLPEGELPAQAVRQWKNIWQDHQCQEKIVPEHGYVALLEPPCGSDMGKPVDEDRYRAVACLLKEIDPLKYGLSAAVLVRSNEIGKRITNFLRGECKGMNIVHEGRGAIKDNPVVSVLLSLVKFAAHPGDTFAWRHLEMSPFRECFLKELWDRTNLPLALLSKIQATGFQPFLRDWGTRLAKAHPLDDFGQKRLSDIINAAGEFDGKGNRDCNAFLHFIDSYELHELAADEAVRVMTIHQSKGLGFDIVLLPDLQKRSMSGGDLVDFAIAREPATNRPCWALKMPRRVIAQNDPVLASQLEANEVASCFDSLCVLYVALTRAKQGLYIITSFPGKSSQTFTSASFLKTQLTGEPKPVEGPSITIEGEEFTCLYETGERDWYKKTPRKKYIAESVEPQELSEDFRNQHSIRRRLVRMSPSTQIEHEHRASELFTTAFYTSLDFGTAIHELWEKVSWFNETDIDGIVNEWWNESSAEEYLKQRATEHFREALASAEVRRTLSRPEGHVDLWREKHFEIIMGDRWITGDFDRVTIVRNIEGTPLRATLLDFKSDEIESDAELTAIAERYRSQLSLYGRALSQILCLDPSQIALQLLFTHPGKVYDLKYY